MELFGPAHPSAAGWNCRKKYQYKLQITKTSTVRFRDHRHGLEDGARGYGQISVQWICINTPDNSTITPARTSSVTTIGTIGGILQPRRPPHHGDEEDTQGCEEFKTENGTMNRIHLRRHAST
jgi:hypothetical protein